MEFKTIPLGHFSTTLVAGKFCLSAKGNDIDPDWSLPWLHWSPGWDDFIFRSLLQKLTATI